jgi:hypothetical protein
MPFSVVGAARGVFFTASSISLVLPDEVMESTIIGFISFLSAMAVDVDGGPVIKQNKWDDEITAVVGRGGCSL